MGVHNGILFLAVLYLTKINNGEIAAKATCDLNAVEQNLQHLQYNLDEKFNGLRRDIWSSSKSNGEQIGAVKSLIESYKNALRVQSERTRRNLELLPERQKSIEQELQLVLVTLRLLTNDITIVKHNISDVLNSISSFKEQLTVDSNIQDVFRTKSAVQQNTQSDGIPTSCLDIKTANPQATTDVYLIQPKAGKNAFFVRCDMDVEGGGWLTIHNRFNGEQDFYLNWEDYKIGFGNIAGEHWLGLEHIYELTGRELNELLIQLVDTTATTTYARYSSFSIGSEEEGYPIKVLGSYQGTAGDSLSYHAGNKFSTIDKDQDSWQEGNCAQSHGGAWWYKSCDKSNLNGRYMPGEQPDFFIYQPMYWNSVGGPQKGLQMARMLIRPK